MDAQAETCYMDSRPVAAIVRSRDMRSPKQYRICAEHLAALRKNPPTNARWVVEAVHD